MIYITFDDYYDIEQYNNFLNSAKNNGVEFSEWINTKTPYKWYIRIDMKDVPKFVDFDIATDSQERFMISKIRPKNPQDEYKLMRRESDSPTDFSKFVVNDYWDYISEKKNLILFKNRTKEELITLSRAPEMKDTKIFLIGNYRGWELAITDNKFILGHVGMQQVLYEEYDSDRLIRKPWDVEAYLNYYIIRTDKIDEKYYDTTYIMNGNFKAIKVSSKYSLDI